MVNGDSIFQQIQDHTYTSDRCFLCGCRLTQENKTQEHVIPKWVQHEFGLWDQTISLINRTKLPYRNLSIPCCFACNNSYLKSIEDKVKVAYEGGFEKFKTLPHETLFYWLGKIYFGILYRELSLNADRSNPEKGTITDPGYLKSFFTHLLFLQGIRNRHVFKDFFPASIYLYKTQKPDDIKQQWDLTDSHLTPFIAIRMGEIGIIGVLQDCEETKKLVDPVDQHTKIELHPLQFRELVARALYKKLLMNRTPKFFNLEEDNIMETHLLPLQGFSTKPIFENWDNKEYAHILSEFTDVPLDICYAENGLYRTWLIDDQGKTLFMDVKTHDGW